MSTATVERPQIAFVNCKAPPPAPRHGQHGRTIKAPEDLEKTKNKYFHSVCFRKQTLRHELTDKDRNLTSPFGLRYTPNPLGHQHHCTEWPLDGSQQHNGVVEGP